MESFNQFFKTQCHVFCVSSLRARRPWNEFTYLNKNRSTTRFAGEYLTRTCYQLCSASPEERFNPFKETPSLSFFNFLTALLMRFRILSQIMFRKQFIQFCVHEPCSVTFVNPEMRAYTTSKCLYSFRVTRCRIP